MDPFETRELGRTGISLTRLGLGGTAVGGLFRENTDDQGASAVSAAYDLGIRYFDTAPFYGAGASERRFGLGLRDVDRSSYVLSTKAGRLLHASAPGEGRPPNFEHSEPFRAEFDFSGDAIRRSVEDSLERMGLDRIDILYVHDPQGHWQQALDESYPAMDRLRSEGTVRAIGAGVNFSEICYLLLRAADFDCFLLAGRYSLMEQHPLAEFFPLCERKGTGIVIGGPYSSGILATGATEEAMYQYRPAPPDVREQVDRIEAVCRTYDVPMAAAALQFPLHHPVVASVIPGGRTPDEVRRNIEMMQVEIPASLWSDLKDQGLLHKDAPVPV